MQQFTVPRDVFFGHGALEHLKTIKGTRALISIGSDRLIESGVVAKVEGYLKEAGMETDLYSGITHDPTSPLSTSIWSKPSRRNWSPTLVWMPSLIPSRPTCLRHAPRSPMQWQCGPSR